jgi:hypothetical protein
MFKTTRMVQPQANLFSAFQQALAKGFTLDFTINQEEALHCLNKEVSNPKILEIILCLTCKASLYLIAADNGLGTWIDYWDV